jgi:hypothetical protein
MNRHSLIGILSLVALSAPVTALSLQAAEMPAGYTLSKTPIDGQYCYPKGNDRSLLYCYRKPLEPVNSASEPKKGLANDVEQTGRGLSNSLERDGKGISNTLEREGQGISNTLEGAGRKVYDYLR